MEEAELLPHRRRAWLTLQVEYDRIKEMTYKDIDFGELFTVTEFSDSDATALAEKYEIDRPLAETLAAAQRAVVFATESRDLRRLAKTMEIDVVDAPEFVKRYADKNRSDDGTPTAGASALEAEDDASMDDPS
jgi:hypothetical protein